MKKIFICFITITIFLTNFINITKAELQNETMIEQDIKVSIDGILHNVDESKPYISANNNIMLPIRSIAERLGSKVNWMSEENEVRISRRKDNLSYDLVLKLYDNIFYKKDNLDFQNTYFEIKNNRSYASLDFFEKALNIKVEFHGETNFVVIDTNCKLNNFETIYLEKIDDRDIYLWEQTIKPYLEDDLWIEKYSYDAGHTLMVPMHVAFLYNKGEWIEQFANHFNRFVYQYKNHQDEIVQERLNRLHYFYLASQYMVLCEKTNKLDLIPPGLFDIINDTIYEIWTVEPAWQWNRNPFAGGMKERLRWKLDTKDVDKSYYRTIIDEENFTMAIAADLFVLENKKINDYKNEILDYAFEVFSQEGAWGSDDTWLFQPGVSWQHGDYAYVGNDIKSDNIEPKAIIDIAGDTSHSTRLPLWINSYTTAFNNFDDDKRDYFIRVRYGLEKQFYENVLVKPDLDFGSYRTKNFMDGRNGIFRWNYPTQGLGKGYGPYELSGTLMLGWWGFLNTERIREAYMDIALLYPFSEDMIVTYVGPNTSRERNKLNVSPDEYYNGKVELAIRLASKLYTE